MESPLGRGLFVNVSLAESGNSPDFYEFSSTGPVIVVGADSQQPSRLRYGGHTYSVVKENTASQIRLIRARCPPSLLKGDGMKPH